MSVIQGNTGPTSATRAAAVTPSDTDDLAATTKALWVGGAGDVEVITAAGDTVVFATVPAGTWLPISVKRVKSANTTASLILAIWE